MNRTSFSLREKFHLFFSQKSKFNKIIDSCVLVFFSLTFFSIPSMSFKIGGNYVTIILVVVLLVLLLISFLKFYKIKIDFIAISLLLFAASSLFSSFINGFKGFNFTPIVLSLVSFFLYIYFNSAFSNKTIDIIFFCIYISEIFFAVLYFITYYKDIISLDFQRLGDVFGDNNDISLFFVLGLIFNLYFLLFKKNAILSLLSIFLLPLFLICGLSTGSKTFIVEMLILIILIPFLLFRKKHFVIIIATDIILILLFVFVLKLPAFSTINQRMMAFLKTLFTGKIKDGIGGELSTQNRYFMFTQGIYMWLQKPLFGWGIWGYASNSGGFGGWSHNNISESLCNYGLIGTLFFHFALFYSTYNYFKSKNKNEISSSFLLIIFYFISMISVVLSTQKIYAFIAPVAFSSICNNASYISFKCFKKKGMQHV